eukprot:scaffold24370_cov130-Isochrysis_galbana.AAC.1
MYDALYTSDDVTSGGESWLPVSGEYEAHLYPCRLGPSTMHISRAADAAAADPATALQSPIGPTSNWECWTQYPKLVVRGWRPTN